MAAQNLVLDGATFSLEPTTTGDDGNTTRTGSGSAVTFKVDRCRVRYNRQLEDHSTGQDSIPIQRTRKLDWEISIETKLEKPIGSAGTKTEPLASLLGTGGVVVIFTATTNGGGVQGNGIVENVEWTHDTPATLTFTLKPYGSDLTVDVTV